MTTKSKAKPETQTEPTSTRKPAPALRSLSAPVITTESPLPDIIKFVLGKCIATLPEDIDSLTPKDRILLWKEYGNFFEPEETKSSPIPGANIKTVTVNVLHNGK